MTETDKAWAKFRFKRDKLLRDTDFTQLADVAMSTEMRGKWKKYRQYLRDCTKLHDDKSVATAEPMDFKSWEEWKRKNA